MFTILLVFVLGIVAGQFIELKLDPKAKEWSLNAIRTAWNFAAETIPEIKYSLAQREQIRLIAEAVADEVEAE